MAEADFSNFVSLGRIRSVMLLMVSADMRLSNCSSRISLIFPCAVADGVQAYDSVCKGVCEDLLSLAYWRSKVSSLFRCVCLWLFHPLLSAPACSCARCGGYISRVLLCQDDCPFFLLGRCSADAPTKAPIPRSCRIAAFLPFDGLCLEFLKIKWVVPSQTHFLKHYR